MFLNAMGKQLGISLAADLKTHAIRAVPKLVNRKSFFFKKKL